MTDAANTPRTAAVVILDEMIEGTEPDRIGQYEPLKKWVHRKAKEARRAIEAAAPTPAAPPDVERLARALYESGVRQTMSQAEASARNVAAEYNRLAAARPEADDPDTATEEWARGEAANDWGGS